MNWQDSTIGEIARVVTKGTTPTTYGMPFTDEGVNFIKAEALNGDSSIDSSGFAFISESTHEKLRRSILLDGDVLVTIAGAQVGKCGIVKNEHLPANTNQAVGIVRVDPNKACPRFIYYCFKNRETYRWCQSIGGQAAQPNINLTVLKGFRFRLPNVNAQYAIAEKLSTFDDLIENNQQRVALLEESARLLYREWFVHFRFPGHEHVKFVDGLPKNWKRRTLGDLVEVIKVNVKPEDFMEEDIHIGLEHIPRRSFTLANWESAEDLASGKWRFNEGDILFGKIRPYFHKVGFALSAGLASSDALVWRVKDETDWPAVLCATSSDHFVSIASKTVREGSKMPRADWKVLEKYGIPRPAEGLLDVFNDAIRSITEQCKTLAFQTNKLVKARDLILPRLMKGEIAPDGKNAHQ